jgi:hypothetical protein
MRERSVPRQKDWRALRIRPMGLVVSDISLPASSPADALTKVGLFLLFVGAGSGSNPLSRGGIKTGAP